MVSKSNLATAVALLLTIMLAAPILAVAPGSEQQAAGTARTRTRTRAPLSARVRCTEVHAVEAGETCASVARAVRFSDGAFRVMNPNITCAALFPGQWVCVAGTGVA
jgi:hypothetical protein